jgi:hypothetical protein
MIIKKYIDDNTVYIIRKGNKRYSYYKFITYYSNELRSDEKFIKITPSKKYYDFGKDDKRYKGCKLHFKCFIGTGFMYGIIKRIDNAELCQILMQ